jgi:hypothetical protein
LFVIEELRKEMLKLWFRGGFPLLFLEDGISADVAEKLRGTYSRYADPLSTQPVDLTKN